MKRIFKGVGKKYLLIFMVFIIAVSVMAVFGNKGLVEAYALKREKDSILSHILVLKEGNISLQEEIDLLKNDTRYVERIARKELGMVGKDEVIYMFEDDTPL
ncbi:MAG: septum formation initiator family protein [Thermodesulfobacteriota bacterium]